MFGRGRAAAALRGGAARQQRAVAPLLRYFGAAQPLYFGDVPRQRLARARDADQGGVFLNRAHLLGSFQRARVLLRLHEQRQVQPRVPELGEDVTRALDGAQVRAEPVQRVQLSKRA